MLTSGTKFGPYEIVGSLGAGGMGEVYRARDTRLDRDVAIKMLPDLFVGDPERIARFEREAKTLAALNHPHIAQIHGLEIGPAEAGHRNRALVMEFVSGETLAERLSRAAIPMDEALPIARQIADALEAAHEHGIVHRDLKPANIMLTTDGQAKVLDFGLATDTVRTGGDLSASPTFASPAMTAAGVILGTAAYMSPEQARGKPVDKRADIWAFGVVLYEMLTGKPIFAADTVSDTIAEVLKRDIDFNALPASTPPSVRRLLERCLQRDPKQRLRDIGDARLELAAPMETLGARPAQRRRGISTVVAAALVLMAGAIAAGSTWLLRRPPDPPQRPVVRVSWPFPEGGLRIPLQRPQLAISPNGRIIAISTDAGITLRFTDQLNPTFLPEAQGAVGVFFSPDTEWVGYWTSREFKKVRVTGGVPVGVHQLQQLSDMAGPSGGFWADDGRVYFADMTGIQAVSANGGTVQTVAPAVDSSAPFVLPGSRAVLFARGRAAANPEIVYQPLDGGAPVTVAEGLSPRYLKSGMLLFVRGNSLLAAPFDEASRRLTAEPVTVVERVAVLGVHPQYAISEEGTLVYLPGDAITNPPATLRRVSRQGKASAITDVAHAYSDPRVSPDGGRVALHLMNLANDIWVQDLARGTLGRVTTDSREDETPVWSPDGQWVAFAGFVRGERDRAVFRRRADGTGAEEVLWSGNAHAHVTDWSPDGKTLVLEIPKPETRSDIALLALDGTRVARPYLATPFIETSGRVSPDGRWLAYQSDETGRFEVYVQAFPAPGAKVQVSTSGGMQPVWSRDGRELYFRSEKELVAARVASGAGALQVGAPTVLFTDPYLRAQGPAHTTFDVLPDGSFIVIESESTRGTSMNPTVLAVFNWFDELKQRVPSVWSQPE